MGLGALSGAAGGMADAVSDIIEQRLRQGQLAETIRRNQADEQLRQKALSDSAAWREMQNQENIRQHNLQAGNQMLIRGMAADEAMPPGTDFSSSSPMAPYLTSVPKMSTAPAPPESLAADPTDQAPVNLPGTIADTPSPAMAGRLRTKMPTFKQQDTIGKAELAQAAAERAQQALDDRTAAAATNADLRERMITQAGELGRARIDAAKAAADRKASTLNLSAGGKAALSSIEQAGPMTDQVISEIEKQYPDIKTNPEKYNTVASKFGSAYQQAWYNAGFASDDEGRRQVEKLLQPVQAGQYMRSSRSRQMLELNLAHMADPNQTVLSQYNRLKTLRALMPEMREGIIRSEKPVDPDNPLAGSYFDPASSGATGGSSGSGGGSRIRYDMNGNVIK